VAAPPRPRAPAAALAAAGLLLALLTWLDAVTGAELELFAFYFAPVSLAAWYAGRRPALLMAVGSAAGWWLSERYSGHRYSEAWLLAWGTGVRLLAALAIAWTMSAIRESARLREDLLHAVSHDLRVPLGVITGQAQLLGRRPGDAAFVAGRGEAILRSARRMHLMIEDLLDGARRSAGRLELALQPLDLAAWLPGVVEAMALGADRSRVEVTVAAGTAPVRADPARLERVVCNLLGNALKYSPPDAPVQVQAAGGGTAVRLTVTDQGPGLSEEDLRHLFARFHRGSAGVGREGVGLGLFSARQLVEAQGGRLEVESRPGAGATFAVVLPAAG
jgi:signal transduction histidine kinase